MFPKQVKLLFSGEKKVCDDVFKSNDTLKDQCFAEVTANSVIVLLSFGEAIAKSKRSPEKLFVLLDMYEIMRELQPEVYGYSLHMYLDRIRCSGVSFISPFKLVIFCVRFTSSFKTRNI